MRAHAGGVGAMALEEGGRVDFERLRRERRARVDTVMDDLDLDVLLLGREPNARYATGVRRLAVASTRPFAPGCVIVRATGAVHLLSTWDDGVPAEVPREHLFGITWNPQSYVAVLGAIAGARDARRVGVDAMTPLFADLVRVAIPEGSLVDAAPALLAARMRKTADEVACVRTAVAITEAALVAAADALRPGVRERELLGVFDERMASMGATVPAVEGTFCVTPAAPAPLRRLVGDGAVDAGDLVAMAAGALYAGYAGPVARTWPCGVGGSGPARAAQGELHRRWERLWGRLADVLRPGATGADLRAAYEASGEPLGLSPVARSVGIGYEAPVAGSTLGASFDARWRLDPGMVLAVEGWVAGADGGYLGGETVLITDDGHEVLSTLGHGPR